MSKASPPLTHWLCPCNTSQQRSSLHHCTCTLLIHVQLNLPASTLLTSAVLLPSQSEYHLLLLPRGCYPGKSRSYSGLFMPLGWWPTRSCFLNSPQTRILFYSSPSGVFILLLAFTFLRTLSSRDYFKAVTGIHDQFFTHGEQVQHHACLVSLPSACVRKLFPASWEAWIACSLPR